MEKEIVKVKKKKSKNRIRQLRKRKNVWHKITHIAIQLFAWGGFAALYYFGISILFYTPYEYALKVANDSMQEEYEALQNHYDSLQLALDNLEERDLNIFNILFESTPPAASSDRHIATLDRYEKLLSKSTEELRIELNSRTKELQNKSIELIGATMDMIYLVDQNSATNRKIPAIQPIVNPQLSLLTASFGMKMHPFYRSPQQHNGVDYTIPEGTRVFATADGVIESTQLKSSTLGKSIVIDHKNGYKTTYNHLTRIFIPAMRSVKRGEIIGLSGNTGLSTAPHLHYEISYNGEAVDPTNYFFMELSPAKYKKLIEVSQHGMQSFD